MFANEKVLVYVLHIYDANIPVFWFFNLGRSFKTLITFKSFWEIRSSIFCLLGWLFVENLFSSLLLSQIRLNHYLLSFSIILWASFNLNSSSFSALSNSIRLAKIFLLLLSKFDVVLSFYLISSRTFATLLFADRKLLVSVDFWTHVRFF